MQAKLRWLRISGLWREKFRKWKVGAQERLRVVKEARAVAAMEERRKQYQADAQQRLAWVDEALAQRIIEDNTCPICSADAGQLTDMSCIWHLLALCVSPRIDPLVRYGLAVK